MFLQNTQLDAPASFSDNVLRLRPKGGNGARSAFVAEYLNSIIGNTQVLRDSRGSLQRVVTQKSLGDVILPYLGGLETEVMARMDTAAPSARQSWRKPKHCWSGWMTLCWRCWGLRCRRRTGGVCLGYAWPNLALLGNSTLTTITRSVSWPCAR